MFMTVIYFTVFSDEGLLSLTLLARKLRFLGSFTKD